MPPKKQTRLEDPLVKSTCSDASTESEGRPSEEAASVWKKLPDGRVRLVSPSRRVKSVLRGVGVDDPAALFCWESDSCLSLVTALNTTPALVLPAWLGPVPITVQQLQQRLLTHINTLAGSGGVLNSCLIAPNSTQQYGNIKTACNNVSLEPVFAGLAHVPVPICRLFIIMDKKANTTGTADPVLRPPPPARPLFL